MEVSQFFYVAGASPYNFIQSAIDAAAGLSSEPISRRGVVWIPPYYAGTDSYTNPHNVPVFDMRGAGSFSGGNTGGSNYQTIQVNNSAQPPEAALNLLAGTNVTLTPVDQPGNTRTNVTIAATNAASQGAAGQIQYSNGTGGFLGAAGLTTADGNSLLAGANVSINGPNPWRDITAYEGVPGTVCFNPEEINGTISSSSQTLTLASAGSFTTGCYVGVAGAGPSTALATPVISSVVFTPTTMHVAQNGFTRSGSTVTVTLLSDASITAGDSITISGATGCATSPNGTQTVLATSFPGAAGNQFTFTQAGTTETCGGSNPDFSSPATIVVNAGSTHYDYQVLAMDYLNGLTAPSAVIGITNGPATLAGMEPIVVTITGVSGAASYPVYRRKGGAGSYAYIGSALPIPTGYSRTTTTITDYGQTVASVGGGSGSVNAPVNVPATVPAGATGQILVSKITAGGGTTILTLQTAASNNATTQKVYHDNSTAFNNALTAAKTDMGLTADGGGSIVYIPPTIMPKFVNLNLGSPVPAGVIQINVAGGLWPVGVVHRTSGNYNFFGTGGGAGMGFTGQVSSIIVTGELNPTWFDDLNGGTANLANFSFTNNPGGTTGLPVQTAIYVSNNEQATYSQISCGQGFLSNYSPCFFADGDSGSGAIFGLTLDRPNFSGGNSYPTPSALLRSCGGTKVKGMRLTNRAMNLDCGANVVASGGGFWLDLVETENMYDEHVFQFDFTNCANTAGVTLFNTNVADGFYNVGQSSLARLISSSQNQNGPAFFQGNASAAAIASGGNCWAAATMIATGSFALGSQTPCTYQILGNGIMQVQSDTATDAAIDMFGTIQAGKHTAVNGSPDTHHFYDPTNGGNGFSFASLPGSGAGWTQRLDTAHASGGNSYEYPAAGSWITLWQPKTGTGAATQNIDSNAGTIAWQIQKTTTPTLTIQANATGGLLAGDLTYGLTSNTPRFVLLTGGSSTNYGAITGTFTGTRVFTLPDRTTTAAGTAGTLTSGNCAKFDASGNVVDAGAPCGNAGTPAGSNTQVQFNSTGSFGASANLTWVSPTLTVGLTGTATGTLALAGGTTGLISIQGQAAAGTYNFNLPITVGSAGQPLLSGAGGSTAMTWGTLSGNTTKFATVSGSLTTGNTVKSDASGNLVDGGGTPTVFQVDGTPLTSDTTVNFQDSNAFNGLTATFANPSAGNVKLGFSGTLNLGGLTVPTTAGDIVCASGGVWAECAPGITINAQTTTSYTVVSTDRNKFITTSNGSAIAVTLPQSGSAGFAAGFSFATKNLGVGAATWTPTTSTIDGAASRVLATGEAMYVYSDGTNYFTIAPISKDSTSTLTNKTYDTAGTGNVFKINGQAISAVSGNTTKVGTVSGALTSGNLLKSDANGNIVDDGLAIASLSGNTTKAATASGTLTSGNLVKFDASGNVVDAGSAVFRGTTGSIGGGLLTIGTCTSGTANITGVTTAMAASASPVTYPGDGNYWLAYVSSANVVTVKVCAVGSFTPTASNYNILVVS